MIDPSIAREIAEMLYRARRDAAPVAPSALSGIGLADAYRIQNALAEITRESGDAVAGWKVGLTSPAAMAAFNAGEPIAGRLFASTILEPGSTIDFHATCDARVEGELLIEIAHPPGPEPSDSELLGSIASVRAAIEVADSRLLGWPSLAAPAVADDACCGWVILGKPCEVGDLDLGAIGMNLAVNGNGAAEGTSASCLGNPLNVYRWFCGKAASLGWKIEQGQFLLTGAIAPPVTASPGTHYEVRLEGIGQVDFCFGEKLVA